MAFKNYNADNRKLAEELAAKFGADDPTYAHDILGILNNASFGDEVNLEELFGPEAAQAIIEAFGDKDEEPVTVTKTTTSVGGNVDPDDAAKAIEDAGGTPLASDTELAGDVNAEEMDLMQKILTGTDEEAKEAYIALNGSADGWDGLAGETTPEEDEMLKQAEKNVTGESDKPADKPADEPPAEKPKEDKPKEETKEPPKEDKPKEEKKEESKADKPAEDKKDEPDDTMKNITSALGGRL